MLAVAIVSGLLFWLLQGHWQHALRLTPYLLFLSCPVMHLFIHRGHGHHGNRGGPPA